MPDDEPRMTAITRRIVESSAAIALERLDDITFQHTVLCQTSMPYQRTDVRRLQRRNTPAHASRWKERAGSDCAAARHRYRPA